MKTKMKFSVICLILVLALFCGIGVSAFATANQPVNDMYEIYPAPHQITYSNDQTTISDKINLFLGEEIDVATENHVYDAFSAIDVLSYKNAQTQGKTNVYVGVFNSGDKADLYVRSGNVEFPSKLFNKTDAYLLSIKGDKIVVLGKDTDSAFYGVTTLKAILEQLEGRTVKNLLVHDWSDTNYRGFIEGYYGFPWSTEDRVELMRFGSQFKTNIYIYAPKDDPYHSSNWRGLYSERDLAELKEQIDAGIETKTEFAWSIHPFMGASNPMTAENYDTSLPVLLNKFNQLYDAGVRQFVISADDISTEHITESSGYIALGNLHRDLLNDVCKWQEQKGDCGKLIFVPSAYCYYSFQNLGGIEGDKYFAGLMDNLDQNVDVMWTGEKICSRIDNGRYEEFMEFTKGRKPFVWMNWPVNDYNQDRLLLSKGEALDYTLPASGEAIFSGIVVNPLERAEASKLSIFSIADYCWNINAFDCDKSYDDSFKYIEPTATEQFREIASHLSNTGNYDGIYFEESPEFVKDTQNFLDLYKAGEDVSETASSLITKFDKVINACDDYFAKAENKKLVEEIEPWVKSLKLTCQAGKAYMEIAVDGDAEIEQKLGKINLADQFLAEKFQIHVPRVNTSVYSTPLVSMRVIEPFIDQVKNLLGDDVRLSAGVYTGIVYRGFPKIHEGMLENIIDGDPETFVWFEEHPFENYYVRIDLGEQKLIKDLTILAGNATGNDTWEGAVVELSTDGKTFIEVGELGGASTTILVSNPAEYRYVRIRETSEEHPTWVALKELILNTTNYTKNVTYENMNVSSKPNQDITGLLDDDVSTYTWFETPGENAYLKLDLFEVKTIKNVQLLMSKEDSQDDFPANVTLSWSLNGESWTQIGAYQNQRHIYAILDAPVQARYIKADIAHGKTNWFVAKDFSVNNDYPVSFGSGYYLNTGWRENLETGVKHISMLTAATDGDVNTALDLAKNAEGEKAIYLDLKQNTTVNSIYILSGGVGWDDFITNCTVSYSVNGDVYTELGNYTANNGEYDITISEPITARYIKILVNDVTWIAVREIAVNKA